MNDARIAALPAADSKTTTKGSEPIMIEDSLEVEFGGDNVETQPVELSQFMDKFANEAAQVELQEEPKDNSAPLTVQDSILVSHVFYKYFFHKMKGIPRKSWFSSIMWNSSLWFPIFGGMGLLQFNALYLFLKKRTYSTSSWSSQVFPSIRYCCVDTSWPSRRVRTVKKIMPRLTPRRARRGRARGRARGVGEKGKAEVGNQKQQPKQVPRRNLGGSQTRLSHILHRIQRLKVETLVLGRANRMRHLRFLIQPQRPPQRPFPKRRLLEKGSAHPRLLHPKVMDPPRVTRPRSQRLSRWSRAEGMREAKVPKPNLLPAVTDLPKTHQPSRSGIPSGKLSMKTSGRLSFGWGDQFPRMRREVGINFFETSQESRHLF